MTLAAIILGIVALAYFGYLPTDILGRVDAPKWHWRGLRRERKSPDHTYAWYQATWFGQVPFVLLIWHLRMARIRYDGRLFVVPGNGDCTTCDDQDRWHPLYTDLPTTEHVLRVRNNHWRHDLTHDAIAIEFATREAHQEFRRRVAERGPSTVSFMDLLGPDASAELTRLISLNRARTMLERKGLA